MDSGIRATVGFSNPLDCPIADFSSNAGCSVRGLATTVTSEDSPATVSEFLGPPTEPQRDDVWPVFDYGQLTLYRTPHDGAADCPCRCLGRHDCPIHRFSATDGVLTLVFHVAEYDRLQEIIEALRENFEPIDVERLLRPPLEGRPEDRVFINRGKLTDRQIEVLSTAFRMGYFERPKGANATEIAAELDISQSTFTEHLMVAQRKLLADILD